MSLIKYVEAGYPALFCTTTEYDRAIDSIKGEINEINEFYDTLPEDERDTPFAIFKWDLVTGLIDVATNKLVEQEIIVKQGGRDLPIPANSPNYPLAFLNQRESQTILILPNYHLQLGNDQRKNVELLQMITNNYIWWKGSGRSLIILAPNYQMPNEINRLFQLIDFELPDEEELLEVMKGVIPDQYINPNYEKGKDKKENQFLIELNPAAIRAAKGLTRLEAENAFSLSIIQEEAFDPLIISEVKQQQIKKSGVLEISKATHKFSDVVGLENIKPYLTKVAMNPLAQGSLLVGVSGCIAGDTKLHFKRGARKSGRIYTVEDAYHKMQHIPRDCSRSGSQYFWNDEMRNFVPAWLGDRVGYHPIDNIICTGVKDVWKVTSDSGNNIKVTKDHPFKIVNGGDEEGFLPTEFLRVGDKVYCRNMNCERSKKRKYPKRNEKSAKYHPNAYLREVNGGLYGVVRTAKLVVEADMNNMTLEEFVHILNTDQESIYELNFLHKEAIVHHKNEDTLDDNRSNLKVFESIQEHNRHHGKMFKRCQSMIGETITSIEYAGCETTYDIAMKDPFRNFVANNFVLHNCGKTYIAEALANEFGIPAVIVSIEKIMASGGGIVGQSERAAMDTFKILDAMSPCIAVFDELEKGLAGVQTAGRSDGGAKAGIGSVLLKWIEKKTPGIYPIATTNDITALPPEYKRSGRWDCLWFVDLPTKEEILGNLMYYPNKFDVEIDYDELPLGDYVGYSHAEVMTIVRTASMLECDLEEARSYVHRIKDVDSEAIALVQDWGKKNAKQASNYTTRQAKALLPSDGDIKRKLVTQRGTTNIKKELLLKKKRG